VDEQAASPIPDDVRRFINDYIDSVPALEALLLLRKRPAQRWTPAELAAELYIDVRMVTVMLAELHARGLCGTEAGAEPQYVWRPSSPQLAEAIDRLADLYGRYLVAVSNLIHGKPRPSVRGFSDAFRLRPKE
jgi:hypothetical protein